MNILDSTGEEPYKGDVLIKGKRIVSVGEKLSEEALSGARIFEGKGRTLMSGMGKYSSLSLSSKRTFSLEFGVQRMPTLISRGPMQVPLTPSLLWASKSIRYVKTQLISS